MEGRRTHGKVCGKRSNRDEFAEEAQTDLPTSDGSPAKEKRRLRGCMSRPTKIILAKQEQAEAVRAEAIRS